MQHWPSIVEIIVWGAMLGYLTPAILIFWSGLLHAHHRTPEDLTAFFVALIVVSFGWPVMLGWEKSKDDRPDRGDFE